MTLPATGNSGDTLHDDIPKSMDSSEQRAILDPAQKDAAATALRADTQGVITRELSTDVISQAPPPPTITLGLSGGGVRAALFHLGVLVFLAEHGALKHVHSIVAVSGGGILAAHVARHWATAAMSSAGFSEVAASLIRFLRTNIRDRALVSWLWSRLLFCWWSRRWSRAARLQYTYDTHFQSANLSTMGLTPSPHTSIVATDVIRRERVIFTSQDIQRLPIDDKPAPPTVVSAGATIALAVAASSCFPPVFRRFRADHRTIDLLFEEFQDVLTLNDGGVAGNLGIEVILSRTEEWSEDALVIVSDAERPQTTKPRGTISPELDALMAAQSAAARTRLKQALGARTVHVPFSARLGPGIGLEHSVFTRLAGYRTDLDSPSWPEVYALLFHGATTAAEAMKNHFPPIPAERLDKSVRHIIGESNGPRDLPVPASRELRNCHRRPVARLVMHGIVVIMLLAAIGAAFGWGSYVVIKPYIVDNTLELLQRAANEQAVAAQKYYDEITNVQNEKRSIAKQASIIEQIPDAMVMQIKRPIANNGKLQLDSQGKPVFQFEYPNLKRLKLHFLALLREDRVGNTLRELKITPSDSVPWNQAVSDALDGWEPISTSLMICLHRLGVGDISKTGDCVWAEADKGEVFIEPMKSRPAPSPPRGKKDVNLDLRHVQPQDLEECQLPFALRALSTDDWNICFAKNLVIKKGKLPGALIDENLFSGPLQFRGCWMPGASVLGSAFKHTYESCNLRKARISGPQSGAVFVKSHLEGAVFGEQLSRAEFYECWLQGAIFNFSHLENGVFRDCKLHGAQFANTEALDTEFWNCELHGTGWLKVHLEGTRFVNSRLCGARFQSARLNGALFDQCNLKSTMIAPAELGATTISLQERSLGSGDDKITFFVRADTPFNTTDAEPSTGKHRIPAAMFLKCELGTAEFSFGGDEETRNTIMGEWFLKDDAYDRICWATEAEASKQLSRSFGQVASHLIRRRFLRPTMFVSSILNSDPAIMTGVFIDEGTANGLGFIPRDAFREAIREGASDPVDAARYKRRASWRLGQMWVP